MGERQEREKLDPVQLFVTWKRYISAGEDKEVRRVDETITAYTDVPFEPLYTEQLTCSHTEF